MRTKRIQVNAYLYTHLKEFGSEYRNADGTPDWKKISKNEELAYCNYDTYMGLSDYNRLRTMIGLSEVQLKEDQSCHPYQRPRAESDRGFFRSDQNSGNRWDIIFCGLSHGGIFAERPQRRGLYYYCSGCRSCTDASLLCRIGGGYQRRGTCGSGETGWMIWRRIRIKLVCRGTP